MGHTLEAHMPSPQTTRTQTETEDLLHQIDLLPQQPGVYLMKSAQGEILYVGKACSLLQRVRSYFQDRPLHGPKIEKMVPLVRLIDTIITDSELEALVLEEQLIRKYQPRYNTLLKNSRGFPYIRINLSDPYPRLEFARSRRKKDKARYFGPYPSSFAVNSLLQAIREMFPIEKCKDPSKEKQVCIYYQIKRCMGHCQKKVSPEEYKEMLQDIVLFLEGQSTLLRDRLKARMLLYSEKLQYEQAGQLRDTLAALQRYIMPANKQKIVGKPEWNLDLIQIARNGLLCHVLVFPIRQGLLQAPLAETFRVQMHDEEEEILTRFVYQFYSRHGDIPTEILLPQISEENALLEAWLSKQSGKKIHLKHPQRGDKKALLEMVGKNAENGLKQAVGNQKYNISLEGLQELQSLLELPELPERIEGFDISHFQGQDTVASMVSFMGGSPNKSDYRRFKIRSAEGLPNDFLSMEEVVTRRYRKIQESGQSMPDLILIDGGKGQVSAALKAFGKLKIHAPALIGLAKREEEIVIPGRKDLVRLPRHSSALRLLQQVRDESHRFALSFQRQRRKKRTLDSELDNISGIGPGRRKDLLRRLGSLDKIRTAELTELMLTGGLPRQVAENVYRYFHPPSRLVKSRKQ